MNKIIYLLAIVMLLTGCETATIMVDGKRVSPIGRTYYTKVNVWYENPDEILTYNYIKGTFLPAGTKVELVELSNNRIKFTNANKDISYNIVVGRRAIQKLSQVELLNRYLSEENTLDVDGEFSKLTPQEQNEVKNGNLISGMSRKAALMAYGYPASNKTASIYSDIWVYLGDGDIITVTFSNDFVSSIKRKKKTSIFGVRRDSADRTIDLRLGMSKVEVIKVMGNPNSVKGAGSQETFEYILEDAGQYWVIFLNGKVVQYGRAGDYGSALPEKKEYDITIRNR